METRLIKIPVDIYGKAPTKYGTAAYKVSLASRPLLVGAGWGHVGSGRGYEYVRPPGGKAGRKAIVDVEVPTDGEIGRIAAEMHADRKAQYGQVLGFLVQYRPAGEVLYTWSAPPSEAEHEHRSTKAEFTFGILTPWSIDIVWDHGDDAEPTWYRHGEGDDQL